MTPELLDLLTQLDSPEMETVQAARQALLARGPGVTRLLEEAVREGRIRRLWELLVVLSELKDPGSYDLFAEELARRNPLTGQACVGALLKYGARGQTLILDMLPGMEYMAMLRAIQLLGEQRIPGAAPRLITMLNPSLPPSVIYTILDALAQIGEPAAIEPVRALLTHSDRHVRQHAEHALGALEDQLPR